MIDESIWGYFSNAGPVVKLVMLMLLLASVISWTFIFQRGLLIKRARKAMDDFEAKFWSGIELNKLYQETVTNRLSGGLASIFQAGFKEFKRLGQTSGMPPAIVMEGVQRAMRIEQSREVDKLEQHLPFLATVGSTSPYVGLFGTVWGIMTSFQALGHMQQMTIATVAPGISEALIATAMGLFAAIPAVIAYNRYSNEVDRLLNHYHTFQEEFATILYRQAHAGEKA